MAIITKKFGKLEYATAESFEIPHCFTTRLGGVSEGYLDSLNLGMHRGDTAENVAANYAILGSALGFDPENAVLTNQIHTDNIRCVTKADALGLDHRRYPACDGLVTRDPGTALVVFTADCTPVLLWDPVTGAVGAAHAGWRGTAADIAGKTARAMVRHFGCDPKNIRAAIGPNIGPCCFDTGPEVPQAMLETYGEAARDHIRMENEKYYVNLKELNALSLKNAGVEAIEISTECTMCRPDRYWCHRITGQLRGSQGAVIVCGGGKL